MGKGNADRLRLALVDGSGGALVHCHRLRLVIALLALLAGQVVAVDHELAHPPLDRLEERRRCARQG